MALQAGLVMGFEQRAGPGSEPSPAPGDGVRRNFLDDGDRSGLADDELTTFDHLIDAIVTEPGLLSSAESAEPQECSPAKGLSKISPVLSLR